MWAWFADVQLISITVIINVYVVFNTCVIIESFTRLIGCSLQSKSWKNINVSVGVWFITFPSWLNMNDDFPGCWYIIIIHKYQTRIFLAKSKFRMAVAQSSQIKTSIDDLTGLSYAVFNSLSRNLTFWETWCIEKEFLFSFVF